MSSREITAEELAGIKIATRKLVKRLGGVEAAGSISRWGKSALAEAYDLNRPDRALPADVIADLERVAGDPLVTAVLARLAGCALVPMPRAGGMEDAAIAKVAEGTAELFAEWARAKADASLTAQERQAVAERLLTVSQVALVASSVLLGKGD